MNVCKELTVDMLPNRVAVTADSPDMSFAEARRLADEKARELWSDPMLVAWLDKKTGQFSPNVTCCDEEKPTWLVYAESRGADRSIDINDQEYVFVYLDSESLSSASSQQV